MLLTHAHLLPATARNVVLMITTFPFISESSAAAAAKKITYGHYARITQQISPPRIATCTRAPGLTRSSISRANNVTRRSNTRSIPARRGLAVSLIEQKGRRFVRQRNRYSCSSMPLS